MSSLPHDSSSAPDGGIATRHLLLPPKDLEAPSRARRLRELGIGDQPIPEFDNFARDLAKQVGGAYGMVNFIDENRQFLAGLYGSDADSSTDLEFGRELGREYGWCPHVVVRRHALVLEDVRDFPRWAGNPVIDAIGIHAYLGAPLIDHTGTALGTVCVVHPEPKPWGREGLRIIKSMAAKMVNMIEQAEQRAVRNNHKTW